MAKIKEKQVGITLGVSSYAIIKAAAEADSRSVRMWLELHIKAFAATQPQSLDVLNEYDTRTRRSSTGSSTG